MKLRFDAVVLLGEKSVIAKENISVHGYLLRIIEIKQLVGSSGSAVTELQISHSEDSSSKQPS